MNMNGRNLETTTSVTDESVGRAQVASSAEWRRHKAHRITAGGVLSRLYFGGAATYLAPVIAVLTVAQNRQALAGLPPISDPAWDQVSPQDWIAIGLIAAIAAGSIVGAVVFIALGWTTTFVAIRLQLLDLRIALIGHFAEGVAKAAAEPVPLAESILMATAAVGIILGCPTLVVHFGLSASESLPALFVPVAMLAGVVCGICLTVALVRDFAHPRDVAAAAASILPRLQNLELRTPSPVPPCVVCLEKKRPRPLTRRAVSRLALLAQGLFDWAGRYSAWPGVVAAKGWVMVVLGWLAFLRLLRLDPGTGVTMTSSVVACLPMIAGLKLGAGTIFEAYLNPDRVSLRVIFGFSALGLAIVANARLLVNLVEFGQTSLTGMLPNYDPDKAMMFLVAAEGCLLYAASAAFLERRGGTPRWTVRQVAQGAPMALIGLAVDATSEGWFFPALSILAGLFIAYTQPERARWKALKDTGRRDSATPSGAY